LWGVLAVLAVIVQWFVTLFAGRPARALHRFLSSYVRYAFHVYAFGSLAANPFPGFTGKPGVYPLDLVLPEPARQNLWKTFFRGVLVVPALILAVGFWGVLLVASVLTWFTALFTAKAPEGIRNVAAWSLRYVGQTNAYFNLLTDVYPHSSPLEGAEPAPEPVASPGAFPAGCAPAAGSRRPSSPCWPASGLQRPTSSGGRRFPRRSVFRTSTRRPRSRMRCFTAPTRTTMSRASSGFSGW